MSQEFSEGMILLYAGRKARVLEVWKPHGRPQLVLEFLSTGGDDDLPSLITSVNDPNVEKVCGD